MLVHPARAVTFGFLFAVAVGTALLWLPLSSSSDTSLLVALFTATSAISVTGLTVVDTAGHWSGFGEAVLMVLMEVGGLGIMTATSLLGLVVANRLGLRTRLLVQAETGTLDLGTVRWLLFSVIRISLVIQAAPGWR
jgi:trk/ktr system potassium uptake protein